ncbi:TonB-dependent receptor [candidate division KSB1 bacterium]|nr:TonB-dependent receptor [candidate division KSB1 bacterium]
MAFSSSGLCADIIGRTIEAETGTPLAGTIVRITKINRTTLSSAEGIFRFVNVPFGVHQIECVRPDYPRLIYVLSFYTEIDTVVKIRIQHSTGEGDIFYIGDIRVESDKDLMPNDYAATTRISSGEIEIIQANSLGDVLEMVPGIEKSSRFGLDMAVFATVRGDENDQYNTFGTKVIVDHAPISNNAEMLIHDPTRNSTAAKGVDLRQIPADNIESVEIIRGIPPARYGDLTSGVINVTTCVHRSKPRLKIKHNPNTREANLYSGFALGKFFVSSSVNYGYTERDRRLTGDEYHRFELSSLIQNDHENSSHQFNSRTWFTKSIDEVDISEINDVKAYSRGYRFYENIWGTWKKSPRTSIEWTMYLHDVYTNRFTSMTVHGYNKLYTGEVQMRGHEINSGATLAWQHKKVGNSAIHELSLGVQLQIENVIGDGLVLDSSKSYYGLDSPVRAYSYNDIPDLSQIALYAEDQVTTVWLKDVTWTLGVRYDMFKPTSINLSKLWDGNSPVDCQHGAYFSPRLGAVMHLSSKTQLRGGFGLAAKIPSLYKIYSGPRFYTYGQDTKHIFTENSTLKGYTATEIKIGIDHRLEPLGIISMEGYMSKYDDAYSLRTYPVWENVLNTSNMPTYDVWENILWERLHGIEFSFHSIRKAGMALSVTGHYRHREWGTDKPRYAVVAEFDSLGNINRTAGWFPGKTDWVAKWFVDYRLDWRIRKAKLWFQALIHHFPLEETWESPLIETGLWSGKVRSYPQSWIMNIRLTKQLWEHTEVSIFVNNVLDDYGEFEAIWDRSINVTANNLVEKSYIERHQPIFWGMKWSTSF